MPHRQLGYHPKIIAEPLDGTRVTATTHTITAPSSEPGFCMNSTDSPDTNEDDYSFKAATEDTEEAGTIAGGKSSVSFYCKDFGGYCQVRVRLKKGAATVFEVTQSIPTDANSNHCADAWDGNVGNNRGRYPIVVSAAFQGCDIIL